MGDKGRAIGKAYACHGVKALRGEDGHLADGRDTIHYFPDHERDTSGPLPRAFRDARWDVEAEVSGRWNVSIDTSSSGDKLDAYEKHDWKRDP